MADIALERTKDAELIKAIVTHPNVYPHISDDFSPKAAEWKPIESDEVFHLLVKESEKILGIFVLIPQNGICIAVHTCLLPSSYGEKAAIAAKRCAQWVWENTRYLRIVTEVPVFNRLARRFALEAGMTEYGFNPRSYMKHGILHDILLLGISKEGTACH